MRIELSEHDPSWSRLYRRHAASVADALGRRALRIEHVGSTSVPELSAKPIVDMVLEVADSAHEPGYLPDLGRAGYRLRIRQPEWFEHLLCNDDDETVNLHVFSVACRERERMVRFRDWLRANPADRDLYARAKRELALNDWVSVEQYGGEAKTEVIAAIMGRAEAQL